MNNQPLTTRGLTWRAAIMLVVLLTSLVPSMTAASPAPAAVPSAVAAPPAQAEAPQATCTGNATAQTNTNVNNAGNAIGAPDNAFAQLYDSGDQIILTLGTSTLSTGSTYSIRWRLNVTPNVTVNVDESTDNSSWGAATGSPFTVSNTDFFDQNITASRATGTRYLRITTTNANNLDLDAVSFRNAPCITGTSGQIDGNVFRDYNANGVRDTGTAFYEPSVAGVDVKAYDATGAAVASTTSDANGNYVLSGLTNGTEYRIEFTLPTNGSLSYLKPGEAGDSTVQFATPPASRHVGFNNPSDYSQTNPDLITPRTAFGPRLAGGGETGLPTWSSGASDNANESVIGIPFTANGDLSPSNAHDVYATLRQTGTLYGMIYQRKSQLVLAGTFFKSYADVGPKLSGASGNYAWLNGVEPLGAIYAVQTTPLASNPPDIPAATNARIYANLNKIIDPSTGNVIAGNPAGVDPRRDPANGVDYDAGSLGDCNGTGSGGAPADGVTCWRHDPVAFMKVGTIGLGDLEEDDAEQFVFVVNLGDKKLYQLPIDPNSANWPITTLAAPPVAIPNTCAVSADAVPGGLGFKDGKLYVGVTCTAKTSQLLGDLKAEVWQFDPVAQTFGASPVFSLPLSYPRGCIFSGYGANETALEGINAPKNLPAAIQTSNCQTYKDDSPAPFDSANWNPWPTSWQQMFENNEGINSYGKPFHVNTDAVQIEHALPWLSDISFDGSDLVLGFRDSGGDRVGNDVRSPNVSISTGVPTQNYVSDGFTTQVYSSNGPDNNQNWNVNWTESGEATSPTGGQIQVVADTVANSGFQLRVQGSSPAGTVLRVQRTAWNGYGTGVGTLSFAFRRDGLEAGDQVTAEISTDGGTNWTTIATFAGPATDAAYRTGIYDINLTNNTVVRFSTNAAMDNNDRVWFDNVRITNAHRTWMSSYVYGSSGNTYDGAGFGDLLRACWNGSTWVLENNGACGGVTTPGANNGQGPSTAGTYPGSVGSPFTGYGEWYWDDSGPGSRNPASAIEYFDSDLHYRGHEQTMMGGTFQQSGWPDIAVTIADQAGFGDGGVARFSNVIDHPEISRETNGNLITSFGATPEHPVVLSNGTADANDNDAGVALRHTQLYGAATGFFGKANGLGDIEALADAAPIELGNRLWRDVNANGRQDPGEGVLAGVTVELWVDNTGDGLAETQVGTAVTNASGLYYFGGTGNVNMTGGNTVLFNKIYEIRINRGQSALSGVSFPTIADQDPAPTAPFPDLRDSDGVTIPDTGGTGRTIAGVRFTTGGPGNNDHSYDFGFVPTADLVSLGNQVWYDLNNNGLLDAGEVGIDGVKVDLYADTNIDGVLTPGIDTYINTLTTAGGGLYNFTNLLPGNYIVHLPQSNFTGAGPLAGMASSTGNNPAPDPDNNVDNDDNGYHLPGNGVASMTVTLTAGAEPGPPNTNTNPTVDFGFFGLGAIGNYVWVDENSDGYQDEGEPGIPNVQVNLYSSTGALVATTYTDSHGGYLFDNLRPGTYYVDVLDGTGNQAYTLPVTGMTQTPPSTFPNDDFGNQAHTTAIPSTTFTGYPVTIGGGQPLENLTADFGYNYNPSGDVNNPPTNSGGNPNNAAVAALGDRVWIDSDGGGDQDPSEIGVSGVQVTLYHDPDGDGIYNTPYTVGGYTPTRLTDANGYYMFDGLPPGAYVVQVTSDVGASHAVLTSGQYNQTGDPDHFGIPGTGVPSDTDNRTTTPVLLGPGDVFLNADFGYQPSGAQLGSIGDTVWFDADADGTGPSLAPVTGGAPVTQGNPANPADANEYGLEGVTVVLIRDSNGNGRWDAGEPIIATDTTDANGQYYFPSLPITDGAGTDDYLVWVNDTNNVLGEMVPTYDRDGAAAPASPSIRTGLGISAVANLATTPVLDQDFGYTNTYQQPPQSTTQAIGLIGDYVWFDVNRDNVQDSTESGVEGVVVELLNSTGTVVLATTTTDENGYYSFGGLPLNTSYIVRVATSNFAAGAPLEGMTNTGGPTGGSGNAGPVVNLTPANPINLVQDFGYAAPTGSQGSIGNLVWQDYNADGIKDANEPPIPGVTIDLYRDLNGNGNVDPGEPLLGTRTTDVNGNYLFSGLPLVGGGDADPEAEYVVDVTDVDGKLAGYWHSLAANQDPNTGISGNTANDAQDRSKVDPFAIEIGSGSGGQPVPNNLNVDFGYYVIPAAVGNFVWLDVNANGIQDAGEPGISGILIRMRVEYPDGTIHSVYTVTGDDPSTSVVELGWYSFGNLLLDEDYRVSSTTGAPQPNQPRYVIISPADIITVGPTTYHMTTPNQGGNDMVDSDNVAGVDETAAAATQGRNNVTQNTANPGNESNPNAGYDFGYAIPMDMGDLPDTPYPTLVSSNGARHQLTTPLKLGPTVDAEYNGQQNATATGDDTETPNYSLPGQIGDDEDGVQQISKYGGGGWSSGLVTGGQGGGLYVSITGGSGVPQVFMSFSSNPLVSMALYYDHDANYNTPPIPYSGTPLASGSYNFYFDIPAGTCSPTGSIPTRVRLSAAGGLTATGLATNGEVEDYIFICQDAPQGVVLASFTAAPEGDGILVSWETASEIGNVGFDLWRGTEPGAPSVRLNDGLIPSQAPGSPQGFTYTWQDDTVTPGTTYYYWLDNVDVSGGVTRHGPVSAAVGIPTAVTLSSFDTQSNLPLLALLAAGMILLVAAVMRRRMIR